MSASIRTTTQTPARSRPAHAAATRMSPTGPGSTPGNPSWCPASAAKRSARAQRPGFATKGPRQRTSKAASRRGWRPACHWSAQTTCRRATRMAARSGSPAPAPKSTACPWLIRRLIDPTAIFLFVARPEVVDVASRFNATAFDIEGVFWSHCGEGANELCTFDVMLDAFSLHTPALDRLAAIVRAADTADLDAAPRPPVCWPPRSACHGCSATISPSSTPP